MKWFAAIFILIVTAVMFSFFKKSGFDMGDNEELPWEGRPSIYGHIEKNIDHETGRLSESAESLPDEEIRFKPDEMRWVAGGMDGAFGHHGGGGDVDKEAERIADLLVAIAKRGKQSDQVELYRILQSDTVMDYIDPALEAAVSRRISPQPYLHGFARFLARDSPDRGAVKFGIALLGLIGDLEDKPLIVTLAKHEEFTLFSAVSLTNMEKDAEQSLFALAQCVDGWGRIHLVERLAETKNQKIKDWMVREGYKNAVLYAYLAYICADAGGLRQAMAAESIDQALFDGCGDLIDSLIIGGPAQDMGDYEDAAVVISQYLHHFPEHPKSLKHFLVLHQIKDYLTSEDWNQGERVKNGWSEEAIKKVMARIDHLADDPEWKRLTEVDLQSDDNMKFHSADLAAQKLGIDTSDIHWKRLRDSPGDDGRWFAIMKVATADTIDQIVAYAEEVIPLETIATGPAEDMGLGPDYSWNSCLDFILQEMNQFPGKGKKLILTGLESPVIRNRHMALRALSGWSPETRDDEIRDALQRAMAREPDDDVKKSIQQVIAGKDLE